MVFPAVSIGEEYIDGSNEGKHKILECFLEQRGEARRWLSLRLFVEWKECFGHKCGLLRSYASTALV